MRSFGVNSTKKDHEYSSVQWNNLTNTNMRECVGQVTSPLACLIIIQANDCDHEEKNCEVQDQDLRRNREYKAYVISKLPKPGTCVLIKYIIFHQEAALTVRMSCKQMVQEWASQMLLLG